MLTGNDLQYELMTIALRSVVHVKLWRRQKWCQWLIINGLLCSFLALLSCHEAQLWELKPGLRNGSPRCILHTLQVRLDRIHLALKCIRRALTTDHNMQVVLEAFVRWNTNQVCRLE